MVKLLIILRNFNTYIYIHIYIYIHTHTHPEDIIYVNKFSVFQHSELWCHFKWKLDLSTNHQQGHLGVEYQKIGISVVLVQENYFPLSYCCAAACLLVACQKGVLFPVGHPILPLGPPPQEQLAETAELLYLLSLHLNCRKQLLVLLLRHQPKQQCAI